MVVYLFRRKQNSDIMLLYQRAPTLAYIKVYQVIYVCTLAYISVYIEGDVFVENFSLNVVVTWV